MKQCPSCLTTYTDDTLRFCLADGSVLNAIDDEESTLIRSSGISHSADTVAMGRETPVRVDIPQQGSARNASPQASQGKSSSLIVKIILAVIGLGILALLVVGIAGAVVYFSSKGELSANTANVKPTQATPTPAKNDRDELRNEIANLQKQLDEQKKNAQPSNKALAVPKQSATTTTARANSPTDGFLALRSLPSSEIGERIVKIPHGATVSVGACGPVVRPVSKSGRWCQATYNGYSGWVFDAFLQY